MKEITTTGSYLLKKKDYIKVLDICCNNGTLLNFYPKKFQKYGIDSSHIIKKLNKKKINVINDIITTKKKNKTIKKKFNLII